VWDIYDTLLAEAATATIGYGLVLVGGAWLAGTTKWAVATRRALAPYLLKPAIAYGALAAIVLVVIVWWAPTPATRNPATAVLLTGMLALGLEGLRRRTAREFPAVTVRQHDAEAPRPEPRDGAETQPVPLGPSTT
jgi:predicted anti-sigma-YlaC factor YlaD